MTGDRKPDALWGPRGWLARLGVFGKLAGGPFDFGDRPFVGVLRDR